jgi:hypothetical protein
LAAVCGLEEIDAFRAVFGVALQLVFDVCSWTVLGAALEEFDGSATAFATKLGVVVFEGLGDGLDLPEGLITSRGTDAATLDFTLVELFTLGYCHD